MSWFQKHLNLTILLIAVVSIIAGCLLTALFNNIMNPFFYYPPYYNGDPSGFVTLGFLGIVFANVLSIIGFSWVIKKKHQSSMFILFFMFWPVSYLLNFILEALNIYLDYFFVIIMASLPLWLAGWVILLVLKNKSKPQVITEEGKN
jgi:Na+/melibiose symporter-like transporter